MKIFDLHCDTIEELREHDENFEHHHRQFDIYDIQEYTAGVQTMAVFVPDNIRGQAAKNFVDDYYHYMNDAVSKVPHLAEMIENVEDIERITSKHKWAFLRSIESGACFNRNLDNINHFASLNFKICGLVWNGPNELGSGPNTKIGLTDFGKSAVKRMEEVGMIVDCSHLNDAGFQDLLEIAEKPFIASHSNIRTCCNHLRNLTDEQFTEIVRRKGLCGINLFSKFLDIDNQRTKESIFRHIYHMLELGGENIIAWGTDFDGDITVAPGLEHPRGLIQFADYLLKMGIKEAIINKLYFENAYQFFKKNLK